MTCVKSDERGAMMLIGLFFAIFAVAALYAAIGVSQAALFKQHMQDGADASALSGAVMQARSMNLIVLLNIVMAALLSVLVALKLVEAVCIAGMIIASSVAYPTYGGSLALLGPLESIRNNVTNLHDQLEDPINEALEVIHDLSDLVRDVAPGAALAVAEGTRTPPIEKVYVGIGSKLPVEDDEFKVLCGKAAEFPIDLATQTIPLPKKGVLEKFVTKPLKAGMSAMARTFSSWFCGEDDSSEGNNSGGGTNSSGGPPQYNLGQDVWYPTDEDDSLCGGAEDAAEGVSLDKEDIEEMAEGHTDDCQKRLSEAYRSSCDGEYCVLDRQYGPAAERARTVCDPANGTYTQYAYQTRTGKVSYSWNSNTLSWERGVPTFEPPREEKSSILQRPCGFQGTISEAYVSRVYVDDETNEVLPVCSNEAPPAFVGSNVPREVSFTEVTHILGCTRHETIPIKIDGERLTHTSGPDTASSENSAGEDYSSSTNGDESTEDSEEEEDDDDSSRNSKRVIEDLDLGDEAFQVRAVAMGAPIFSEAERIVRLSLWGHEPGQDGLSKLRSFSGMSAAQAEFFYDEDESEHKKKNKEGAWMWNMKWRARMVRFRAEDKQLDPLRDKCRANEAMNGSSTGWESVVKQENRCVDFLDELVDLGSLIGH